MLPISSGCDVMSRMLVGMTCSTLVHLKLSTWNSVRPVRLDKTGDIVYKGCQRLVVSTTTSTGVKKFRRNHIIVSNLR
jgi:hypothetical protein